MTDAHDALLQLLVSAGANEYDAGEAVERMGAGDPAPALRLLFIKLLWSEVVEEAVSESGRPVWIERWLELGANGFPFINAEALGRLVDSGADLDDVTDVVRSAQTLMIYNVANLIDDGWGALRGVVPDSVRGTAMWELCVSDAAASPREDSVGSLHESLEGMDPTGRFAAPRSLFERRFTRLPQDEREAIHGALAAGHASQAAVLWRRATGDDVADARDAVKGLATLFHLRL